MVNPINVPMSEQSPILVPSLKVIPAPTLLESDMKSEEKCEDTGNPLHCTTLLSMILKRFVMHSSALCNAVRYGVERRDVLRAESVPAQLLDISYSDSAEVTTLHC